MTMRSTHTLSMILRAEPGALARVVVLFSTRGVVVDSLVLAPEQPGYSRLDVVVSLAEGRSSEQLMKQLARCHDVVRVVELTSVGNLLGA